MNSFFRLEYNVFHSQPGGIRVAEQACLGRQGIERIFWLLGFSNPSKGINELDYLMGIPNPQHSLQAMRFNCV